MVWILNGTLSTLTAASRRSSSTRLLSHWTPMVNHARIDSQVHRRTLNPQLFPYSLSLLTNQRWPFFALCCNTIKALVDSLINLWFKKFCNDLHIFWVVSYFFKKKILQNLPETIHFRLQDWAYQKLLYLLAFNNYQIIQP